MRNAIIVMPTYNESQNLPELAEILMRIGEELEDYRLHLLVVDSNSPDDTASVARELQKLHPTIHLLSTPKEGLGKAYINGFTHALKYLKPNIILQMDADFSHDPYAIPRMLKAIDDGSDYVIGSRYINGGTIPGNWPVKRIINSRVANFVARQLGGIVTEVSDMTGGFKAIRADKLKLLDLGGIKTSGYALQMHLLNEFSKQGAAISEVPITFLERKFGTSKIRLKDITEFFTCAYNLNIDSPVKRILRFGLVGIAGSILNILAVYLLVHFAHLMVVLAVGIAIELSIVANYIMHHHFTFRHTKATPKASFDPEPQGVFFESLPPLQSPELSFWQKLVRYNIGALAGGEISLVIFLFMHTILHQQYLVAEAEAIGLATVWNYMYSTKMVWKSETAILAN